MMMILILPNDGILVIGRNFYTSLTIFLKQSYTRQQEKLAAADGKVELLPVRLLIYYPRNTT